MFGDRIIGFPVELPLVVLPSTAQASIRNKRNGAAHEIMIGTRKEGCEYICLATSKLV